MKKQKSKFGDDKSPITKEIIRIQHYTCDEGHCGVLEIGNAKTFEGFFRFFYFKGKLFEEIRIRHGISLELNPPEQFTGFQNSTIGRSTYDKIRSFFVKESEKLKMNMFNT